MAQRYNREDNPYTEKLIKIDRVTKVTKGGKNLGFRALVIVGDLKGLVSLATSKSKEVPLAIRRAIEKAKKSLHKINIENGTIPHKIIGKFKSSTVVLRPAPEGTGVIAGGSIRVLLELVGLENVVAKSIGSNNPLNMARAALNGLMALKSKTQVEARRGVILQKPYKKESSEDREQSEDKQEEKDRKETEDRDGND
jgi:small subunit ribosomal protein S5